MTRFQTIAMLFAAGLLSVVANTPARADFRLQAGAQAPIVLAPAAGSPPERPAEPARRPVQSGFKLARGFGQEVPLSFAVRQIVPSTVAVRFGKDVDPNLLVTWQGDAPWNRVLAAAVRPLGYKITTGATTVLIAR